MKNTAKLKNKLPVDRIEHNWDKCDKGKSDHPFTSFNGGHEIPTSEMIEVGYRDYVLANKFMASDKPFIIRESGFSGNLNGIICRKADLDEINK